MGWERERMMVRTRLRVALREFSLTGLPLSLQTDWNDCIKAKMGAPAGCFSLVDDLLSDATGGRWTALGSEFVSGGGCFLTCSSPLCGSAKLGRTHPPSPAIRSTARTARNRRCRRRNSLSHSSHSTQIRY